jgi:hypothetical protein
MTQLELGRRGVQAQVVKLYERVGCIVARTAQSYRRGSHRQAGTPGIPDLYVFPPLQRGFGDRFVGAAPWFHESKAPGGRQRPEQREWQERCEARGVAYVLGGTEAALVHLRKLGLAV